MDARTRPPSARPMRFTLAGLLIIPLVSLIALWAFGTAITLGTAIRDRNYNASVGAVGPPLEHLEGELTQERLQTFIWLSTGRRSPVAALDAIRKRTDSYVESYRAVAPVSLARTPQLARGQALLERQLRRLPATRTDIDSGAVSPAAAFQDYSAIVDDLLNLYDASGGLGLDSSVYTQDIASINTARALEYLGREAALAGGAAAAGGQMNAEDRALFAMAVANQRTAIGEALTEFDPAFSGPFRKLYSSPQYRQLAALEDQIARGNEGHPLSPATLRAWQGVSAPFLGELLQAQVKNNGPLGQLANRVGSRAVLEAILAGGLGLVAVIVSILLMVRFGRRLAGDLSRLHHSVASVAEERLPSVVERLRRGDEVDVAAESLKPPASKITEIATVANAFATVQRTAVEAAVGQANMRKGINRVFLNISLRSQSLLHRQLTMMDTMERAARDPGTLADLFRLDHLTTRMRRHAESLIIMSGATPGRGWREPVPAMDVLRAAVAEVEDYVRVDVVSESRDAVLGTAVNDVIHLVAELVENATAFSPPTTQVEVRADAVGAGFAVEVEDRGLGMPDEEMAELNARLASSPEFDLANSEQLGLFVVGRLAARHGIRVSLRGSAYGGTTAVVLLPRDIVVADGDDAQTAARHGALPVAGPAVPDAPAEPPAGAARASGPRAPVFSLTGRHRLGWTATLDDARVTPAAARPASGPSPDAWPQPAWREPVWPGTASAAPARRDSPAPGPEPATAGTHLGLPVRVRQASLAPQLRGDHQAGPGGPGTAGPGAMAGGARAARTPEQARNLMAALQRGWEHGRTDDLDDVPGTPADWPGQSEGGGR